MTQEEAREAVSVRPLDVVEVVKSSNQFASALYSQLAADSPDNLFFSPSSITIALAMTFAGANGDTAEEIANVLRFTLPPELLHPAFRQLQESTRTGSVELHLANRLWGQSGYRFLPEFLRTTEQCYRAGLAAVDFEHDTESARQAINLWVAEQTAGKVTNLLSPGSLTAMSRLVLTNAIYFLGSWESEFDEADTKDAPFWSTAVEKQTVPTMSQKSHFRYGEFDDLQVLEMPYRQRQFILAPAESDVMTFEEPAEDPNGGSDLVMCILLPRSVEGLHSIESQLSTTTLQRWTILRSCEVEVHVPRFRIDSGFSLCNTWQAMGIRKAFFRDQADFSRMSDDPEGLFISDAVHKAVVDVNEKGTEAAAATAVVMMGGANVEQEPLKIFRADHPFLFLIRDRTTRLIHFMGRLTSPSEDGNHAA